MDKLTAAWHVFGVVAPWLAVSFVPSLITGLTLLPESKGKDTALNVCRKFLSLLSLLHFSDAPGTFKLPLTLSK